MSASSELQLLRTVVNLPTAPFAEQQVIRFIRQFVSQRSALSLKPDPFGNLLIRYQPRRRSARAGRPVLFAAHMDHPGFSATGMTGPRHVHADFRGWVLSSYFSGQKIQFFSQGRWVPGVIEKVIRQKQGGPGVRRAVASARSFGADAPPAGIVARVRSDVEAGSPGMWSIPDARVRGKRFFARACDDLAGLSGILAMLDVLCRVGASTPCYAFFTRAEEVGFAGALAAVEARTVPRDALVVAVECSKAITGVAFGDGPVLRVGDKASVFTPAATAYCQVVAEELSAKDKSFRFQRKLMDGGTCESTAYCHFKYDATGICLPLGTYHNMNTKFKRIAPEFIDVRDYHNLVKWFVALAQSPAKIKFDGAHPGLAKRLNALLIQHRSRLQQSAKRVVALGATKQFAR